MNLTAQQRQIAYQIDKDVQIIGQNARNKEAAEEELMNLMPKYMDGFKKLLDAGIINEACEEYHGFYIYAEMMERVAMGCRDGLFDDIIADQIEREKRAN